MEKGEEEEELNNDPYLCAFGVHVQIGAFLFLFIALLISMGNIGRGIVNQDEFYTVGSIIDFGVIVLALVGNRLKSRNLYQPFFAVHLILTFFLSVIAILLFIKLYERNERRKAVTKYQTSNTTQRNYESSGALLFGYILILFVHSYAMKVIYHSYVYMGMMKLHKKKNVKALKALIERERKKILAARPGNEESV